MVFQVDYDEIEL